MLNKKQFEKVKKHCEFSHAKLVAVTKTRSVEDLQELYNQGHRIFGENRVQELLEKKDLLPNDIEWHLIGHLQTNKVKYIAELVSLIHAVDSIKLLKEIEKQANNNDRVIDCLLQFHVAQEESKFCIPPANLKLFMQDLSQLNTPHIRIRGIMGMASFVEDETQVRGEFQSLKEIFNTMKNDYFISNDSFDTLSMGMSGDYRIALVEGSTMIRIGSLLFS